MAGQFNIETVNDTPNSRTVIKRLFFTFNGLGTITDTDNTGGIKVANGNANPPSAANFFITDANKVIDISELKNNYRFDPISAVRLTKATGTSNHWQWATTSWNLVDSNGKKYVDFQENPVKLNFGYAGGYFRSDAMSDDADGNLYFAPTLEPRNGSHWPLNQTLSITLEFCKCY